MDDLKRLEHLAKRKAYREANKEKINASNLANYHRNKERLNETTKRWQANNKERVAETRKKYVKENADVISEKRKLYRQSPQGIAATKTYKEKNKETIQAKSKEYRSTNKDKIMLAQRVRRNSDPLFKMKSDISTLIRNSFKYSNSKKNTKTQSILGCDMHFFKAYLESKFEPWMSWDNRGLYNGTKDYGWDFDHIVPISSAKTQEEIVLLNHYSNFQPLCGYINRHIKRAKML